MDNIELYYCKECGWVGTEDQVEMIAGYLWDYDDHEACPNCWEKDCSDNPVDWLSEINNWHHVADICKMTDKEITVSADAIISLDNEIRLLEKFINGNNNR